MRQQQAPPAAADPAAPAQQQRPPGAPRGAPPPSHSAAGALSSPPTGHGVASAAAAPSCEGAPAAAREQKQEQQREQQRQPRQQREQQKQQREQQQQEQQRQGVPGARGELQRGPEGVSCCPPREQRPDPESDPRAQQPEQQQQQQQQQQEPEQGDSESCGSGECAFAGANDDTPLVVLGRCRSSDGWRHGSSSGSDESYVESSSSSTRGAAFDSSCCGGSHGSCGHWRRGLGEEKTEAVDGGTWIREAVRYMELVVEGSSSTEAAAAAAAAAAASYCSRMKSRLAAGSRSLELSQGPQLSAASAAAEVGPPWRSRLKAGTAKSTLGGADERPVAAAAAAEDEEAAAPLQQVHVLVLQLYKQLQQIARQVLKEDCDCSHCPCIQQGEGRRAFPPVGEQVGSNNSSSSSSSRVCACCAFSPPLRIGAALAHLYSENPARFSLLMHDSLLLALLPLQRHAVAALADAVLQQPSPLASLLLDEGPSRLLEETAEATAAGVVAAGASCRASASKGAEQQHQPQQQQQQQGPQQPQEGAADVPERQALLAAALGRAGSNSSIWSVVEKMKRRSWPGCLGPANSGQVGPSYSCCGVPLCVHKRAAAKRFVQRQRGQQSPWQRQLQQLQQLQQQTERQQQPPAKDAEACLLLRKEGEGDQGSRVSPMKTAAAKTAAAVPAAAAGAAAAAAGGPECSGCGYASAAPGCAGCARVQKQLGLFNSSTEPPWTLGQYVTRLQHLASATEHEMLMALLLLTHLQQRQQQLRISQKNAHRLLLAALVLVSKVVRDDHTPLAMWAVVGGVPPRELAALELALLELVGHRVSFTFPEFAAAYCLAAAVSHLQQQQRRPSAQQKQRQQLPQLLQLPQLQQLPQQLLQLRDVRSSSADPARQRFGEGPAAGEEEEGAAAGPARSKEKRKESTGSDISASREAECEPSINVNSAGSIVDLSSRPPGREKSLVPLRCKHTVAALPRPALKTNPILRRLAQLRGDASWL